MKKLFIIATMAIAAISASAADWYTGGQLTFGRTTESLTGNKTTQVTILPELGYNINDHWAVGSTLGIKYRKSGGEERTVFQVNPYLRYTYFKYQKLDLFVDGGVDLGMGRADGSFALEYGIGFKPGIAFHINDKFSLVAHVGFLGYQSGNNPAKHNGAPENWGFNLDSTNILFGFYYNF